LAFPPSDNDLKKKATKGKTNEEEVKTIPEDVLKLATTAKNDFEKN